MIPDSAEIDARLVDIDQQILNLERVCSESVSRLRAEKTELLEVKALLTKEVEKIIKRLEKLQRKV